VRAKTLIATALPVTAAAAAGSLAARPSESNWYNRLRTPRYQPPHQAFPIAWTLLYGNIAVSSAATIDRFNATGQHAAAQAYIRALGVNLALNAAWSWLFFNRHMLKTSAAAASALAVSSADLTRRAAAADLRASLPLTLYPIWCSFASVLATHIWRLNR
jgi:benzodiazapine receptor